MSKKLYAWGKKKKHPKRMLSGLYHNGRLLYSFKLLVGKHAQIVILWWNRFHLGHILDYEFIIVQREYLVNRIFPYKGVALDSIMLHHRIFNCGDDDLDAVKARIDEEVRAGRAGVAERLERVEVGEVLAEARAAGLPEEAGRAVHLGLENRTEERVDALGREDARLARLADVEERTAELHEIRRRRAHVALALMRREARVLHAERIEDARLRDVRNVVDARHPLDDFGKDVIARRHVLEALARLELPEHRAVELLGLARLLRVPAAVAPARGVRHQVEDRHVVRREERNVALDVVVVADLALLGELREEDGRHHLRDGRDMRRLRRARPLREDVLHLAVLLEGDGHHLELPLLHLVAQERVKALLGADLGKRGNARHRGGQRQHKVFCSHTRYFTTAPFATQLPKRVIRNLF